MPAGWLLMAFLAAGGLSAAESYWDLQTFLALRALSPELAEARPLSLAPAGFELWQAGQLRLPESPATTLSEDFDQDGRLDRAVLVESDQAGKRRVHLLIATFDGERWTRRFLERPKEPVGVLLWDGQRRVLALDTDRTRRISKPAVLSYDGVKMTQEPGSVIEERWVVPYPWSARRRRFAPGGPYWYRPP